MALTLSRNSRGLQNSLTQRMTKLNKTPLVHAAPVQVVQVATLKHMGTDRYPYVKPFPYWKKRFTLLHNIWENSNHRMCEQTKVIVVDGNPGVGKHKFAQRLAQEFDLMYFRGIENDDLWVQPWNGFNKRDLNDVFTDEECKLMDFKELYNDPNLGENRIKLGRAARMQYECMVKRAMQYSYMLLHLLSTGQGIVTVRSPYTEPVFARAMRDMGWLSGAYANFHIDHWQGVSHLILSPHLNIYLDAPVEVCMDNMKKRQQQNPNYANGPNMNEEYLTRLNHHYREFLDVCRKDHEVVELDWAEAADESELDVIWEFLTKLHLEPEDFEGVRYYDWARMTEDKTGDRRRLYQDRGQLMSYLDNGIPHHADEFKMHYTASDQVFDVYDQHPMTRYRQNYVTAGMFNMLMGGGLTNANMQKPVMRKNIHYEP